MLMKYAGLANGGGAGDYSGSSVDIASNTGGSSWSGMLDNLRNADFNGVVQLANSWLQYKNLDATQKAFLQLNIDRARAGQPPLDWSNFQPGATVGFQLDPQTRTALLILGAGLIGALVFMRK